MIKIAITIGAVLAVIFLLTKKSKSCSTNTSCGSGSCNRCEKE